MENHKTYAFFRVEEVEIEHVRGSGPGGQNRNKRFSGIRVTHKPTGISVWSTERRSQSQNLEAALERLDNRLKAHFHRPKPRVATKKTKASDKRRLESKQKAARLKKDRRHRDMD